MKDPRHHRTKLQKRVFREAKKHALSHEIEEEKITDDTINGKANIIAEEHIEHQKKKVPIIRKHKKRFH